MVFPPHITRIASMITAPPDPGASDPAAEGSPTFVTRGLTKIYRTGGGEVHALRGVDRERWPSELVVMLGPSGSGKSTFLHILGGLDVPTGGEALDRGRDLMGFTERPSILLCDEPTGALDSETGILVLEAIDAASRALGTTTILITHNVVLDIAGTPEPVNGLLSSLPKEEDLNQLHLTRGRLVSPGSTSETVLTEAFANAHRLSLGDGFWATIKGHPRRLTMVGVALSPEYVFFGMPGAMAPDDERFGVLWMDRDALAAAFDLKGAFNDTVLALSPDADEDQVIAELDTLLKPYGGVGAYGRADQVSNATLTGEIEQLRSSIFIAASVFLGLVAFLVHMVMVRHVETEREQIGALKAFGYSNAAISGHWMKFTLAIVATGGRTRIVGARAGQVITELYARHYRFLFLKYSLSGTIFVQAAVIQLAAALVGALGSLRKVIRLAPAMAMRAPPPPVYRHTCMGRLGLAPVADHPTRVILLHMARWPVRSGLTIPGIAGATAILVAPLGVFDSATLMIDTHFFRAERQDMTVAFAQTGPHKGPVRHSPLSGRPSGGAVSGNPRED